VILVLQIFKATIYDNSQSGPREHGLNPGIFCLKEEHTFTYSLDKYFKW